MIWRPWPWLFWVLAQTLLVIHWPWNKLQGQPHPGSHQNPVKHNGFGGSEDVPRSTTCSPWDLTFLSLSSLLCHMWTPIVLPPDIIKKVKWTNTWVKLGTEPSTKCTLSLILRGETFTQIFWSLVGGPNEQRESRDPQLLSAWPLSDLRLGQGGGERWRGEDFLTLGQDCQSQLGASDRRQPPAPKQTDVAANGGASSFWP